MNDSDIKFIKDRIEIHDTITRYAYAADTQNFNIMNQVFTKDSDLDYNEFDGPRGDRAQIIKWLKESREAIAYWNHLLSNMIINIDADKANARTDVHTVLGIPDITGNVSVMHVGASYIDELIRTEDGWRICKRKFMPNWVDGGNNNTSI